MKVRTDPLDTLCSEFVRKRAIAEDGGCQRCLTSKFDIQKEDGSIFPAWKQLETSHFIGRTNRAVRYDPDNLVGICAGCHMYLGSHPLEHVEWFKNRLGEQAFDMLNSRARTPAKYIDKEAIRLYLKIKIEELEWCQEKT